MWNKIIPVLWRFIHWSFATISISFNPYIVEVHSFWHGEKFNFSFFFSSIKLKFVKLFGNSFKVVTKTLTQLLNKVWKITFFKRLIVKYVNGFILFFFVSSYFIRRLAMSIYNYWVLMFLKKITDLKKRFLKKNKSFSLFWQL